MALSIHPHREVQLRLLLAHEVPTQVSHEDFDYVYIFPPNLPIDLLKRTNINNYTIELEKDNELLYNSIYSPGLVEI